eukprot:Em0012g410a
MCRFEGDTLRQVRQLWKIRLEGSFDTPISRVSEFRSAQRRGGYKPVKVSGTVSVMMGTGEDAYPPGTAEAREMEYNEYTMNGVALAECVCDLPLPTGASTLVNPTFFDRTDAYTLYSFVPYKCFYHSVQFSAGALLQANIVQQFALWMNGAAKVMQARKYAVKFTFHCSDAVEYCQELSQTSCPTFDVIYTSNVIDYLGPLILVLSAVPLLSENGVLVSTSLHYLNLASDTDEYLSSMLGLLPVLFDIQSISKCHDMGEVQIHTTENGNIAGVTIDSQCSAQHCADAPSTTYQYWDGLSQLLKADDTFKLHMSHFQTLALLHGLHLHLVYTASDCPLCNQEAVTEAVKQITIEFAIPPPHDALASPIYIALITRAP